VAFRLPVGPGGEPANRVKPALPRAGGGCSELRTPRSEVGGPRSGEPSTLNLSPATLFNIQCPIFNFQSSSGEAGDRRNSRWPHRGQLQRGPQVAIPFAPFANFAVCLVAFRSVGLPSRAGIEIRTRRESHATGHPAARSAPGPTEQPVSGGFVVAGPGGAGERGKGAGLSEASYNEASHGVFFFGAFVRFVVCLPALPQVAGRT